MIARLSAVLRRVRVRRAHKVSMLRAGHLEMDPERRLIRLRGEELSLSPQEFDLLLFFMKNRELALTHIKLLNAIRGSACGFSAENLRPYIKALRRKIESDPMHPEYILTEPWVGYRFHNPGRRTLSLGRHLAVR
jgi:two-component system, OmpR family, KDP operon response regulator KdpE